MSAKIALRKIVPAARDFTNLREADGPDVNADAHRIAITLRDNQFEIEEMVAVASAVAQKQGRSSIIAHNHIHETVVVEVCERHASPDVWRLESASGCFRCFREVAVAFVVEQRVDLLEMHVRRDLLHFRIHMTVGDEQIKPAIVVVIEEAAAKAEYFSSGNRDPRLIAHLVKRAFSIVVPKMIRVFLEIGDKEIEPAIIVVVAQGNAHSSHHTTASSETHPRGRPNLIELALAFVVVEKRIDALGGLKQ